MADVGGAQTKHTLSLTVLESMMHLQGLPVHIEIDELSLNAILAGMRRAFEQAEAACDELDFPVESVQNTVHKDVAEHLADSGWWWHNTLDTNYGVIAWAIDGALFLVDERGMQQEMLIDWGSDKRNGKLVYERVSRDTYPGP